MEDFCGCCPVEDFAGSVVDFGDDFVEFCLGEVFEAGSFVFAFCVGYVVCARFQALSGVLGLRGRRVGRVRWLVALRATPPRREAVNGLYSAECLRTTVFHDGPYQTIGDVEFATAGGDWYNAYGFTQASATLHPSSSNKPTTRPSIESYDPHKSGKRPETLQSFTLFTHRKTCSINLSGVYATGST